MEMYCTNACYFLFVCYSLEPYGYSLSKYVVIDRRMKYQNIMLWKYKLSLGFQNELLHRYLFVLSRAVFMTVNKTL